MNLHINTLLLFFVIFALENSIAFDQAEHIKPQDDKTNSEFDHQNPVDVDKSPVLTNGNADSKRGRYGSVLGHGFSFGKRHKTNMFMTNLMPNVIQGSLSTVDNGPPSDKRDIENVENDFELVNSELPLGDKRWVLSDIYGGGYFNKRAKRDAPNKRYIHYFGNVLGRGFSFGKRDKEIDFGVSDDDETSPYASYENGLNFYSPDENQAEEKRGYSGILGKGYMFGKRRMSDKNRRRYFGSVLGGGFTMGKRGSKSGTDIDNYLFPENKNHEIPNGETHFKEQNKRYFLSSPGYRFMFGKRDDSDRDKRYGFLLGRPFSGRKRFTHPFQMKRPFGLVLGSGFSFGKRSPMNDGQYDSSDVTDSYPSIASEFDDHPDTVDKRAGYVLGRGYMLGKRGFKRFGWVLGNGRSFGKRSSGDSDMKDNISKNDVSFIDDDGFVYMIANNEAATPDIDGNPDIYDSTDDDVDAEVYQLGRFKEDQKDYDDERPGVEKRFGFILGRGNFGFGKRAPSWKRFGHILGSGFSFGK